MEVGHAAMIHDRHAGHSVAMFRDKFWLTFALTIPVRATTSSRSRSRPVCSCP